MRRRRLDGESQADAPRPVDRRRSEAGDTLVEILIALTVIGIAGTAILLAFATTIAGSGTHRNVATMDSMLQDRSRRGHLGDPAAVERGLRQLLGGERREHPRLDSTADRWLQRHHHGGAVLADERSISLYVHGGAGTRQLVPCRGRSDRAPGADHPGVVQRLQRVDHDGRARSQPADRGRHLLGPSHQAGMGGAAGKRERGVRAQPAADPRPREREQNNCVVQTDASGVQLAIASNPTGATLNNCVPSLGYGETSFQNCNINTPGTYTLQATDPTDGLTSPVSGPFTITPGIPTQLVFKQQPGNGTGGTALTTQPTVWIEDSSGNVVQGDSTAVTLAIGTNASNGTLSGCTSTTTNGVATFSGCKIDKAGNGYTLTATDAADNLTVPSAAEQPLQRHRRPGGPARLHDLARDDRGRRPLRHAARGGDPGRRRQYGRQPPARCRWPSARTRRAAPCRAAPSTTTVAWPPSRLQDQQARKRLHARGHGRDLAAGHEQRVQHRDSGPDVVHGRPAHGQPDGGHRVQRDHHRRWTSPATPSRDSLVPRPSVSAVRRTRRMGTPRRIRPR